MDITGPLTDTHSHDPKYCSKSQEHKDVTPKPNQKISSQQILISSDVSPPSLPQTHRTKACQAGTAVGGAVILLLSPGMKSEQGWQQYRVKAVTPTSDHGEGWAPALLGQQAARGLLTAKSYLWKSSTAMFFMKY